MVGYYLEGRRHGRIIILELLEEMFTGRTAEDTGIWHADHVYYQLNLFPFICSGEQWEACEKLDHYASKGPHVNLLSVREDTEHDIGCTIETALNVGVYDFVFKTATAKVSDCDPTLIFLLH